MGGWGEWGWAHCLIMPVFIRFSYNNFLKTFLLKMLVFQQKRNMICSTFQLNKGKACPQL